MRRHVPKAPYGSYAPVHYLIYLEIVLIENKLKHLYEHPILRPFYHHCKKIYFTYDSSSTVYQLLNTVRTII